MKLKDWRKSQHPNMSLETLGRLLGCALGRGAFPAVSVMRWEDGQTQPQTYIVEAFRVITNGCVEPNDFHDTRVAYLRSKNEFIETCGDFMSADLLMVDNEICKET